jgi:hypothetical protein
MVCRETFSGYKPGPVSTYWIVPHLCRLDPELVFLIASKIKTGKDDREWFFLNFKERTIYCRWDAYVRHAREVILPLLLTGFIKRFVLHTCHVNLVGVTHEVGVTRRKWVENKQWAFDEIRILIQGLPDPTTTEFVVDCAGILSNYSDGVVPRTPYCSSHRNLYYCGMWTANLLGNQGVCMCCSWGCFSPPERRWSVYVVHLVTHC